MPFKKLFQQIIPKSKHLGIAFPSTWECYSQVAIFLILISVIVTAGLICPVGLNASQIDELKSKISEKSSEMQKLEEEINVWEKELTAVGEEKQSLNKEINYLNLTGKKLNSDISLTTNQINATGLEIQKLGIEIDTQEIEIQKNSGALSEAMRVINEQEEYSFLESILAQETLAEFWNDLENLQKVQIGIKEKTAALKELKEELISSKTQLEQKTQDLSVYQSELSDQKEIVESNQSAKNNLLAATKSKESNYQKILDEKLALKERFEAELRAYEDQLRLAVDPGSIPKAGFSVLAWPVDNVYITQFFGQTPFATANPQVYGSGGHNGVDFRASVGTKIKTALSGTVVAVGNTDDSCPSASYGKWVFVRHNNGLSTLYAHLSLIKVSGGQILTTGDVVGYSGNTGYSTGPHLHFGVYATEGVEVKEYSFKSCAGKSTVMPLVTRRDAYLNPLSYLPEYKN
ncbi:MAG: peptidoglycan DD-metalloendopeptidase family protein [Patescibacteria group bacterium]